MVCLGSAHNFPGTRFRGISFNAEQDEDFHEATRRLLQYFNTGIVDIRRFPVRSKEETNLPDRLLDKIISSSTPGRTALVAAPESNECFFFDFKEDGTYTIFKQKAVHRNDADDEVVLKWTRNPTVQSGFLISSPCLSTWDRVKWTI